MQIGPILHLTVGLASFAVTPGQAPNAVRLALAAPTMDLQTLAALLNTKEDDFDSTE